MVGRRIYTEDRKELFMNKFIGIGHIVREPSYGTTKTGINTCTFTVAINRKYKDTAGNYPADFINCVAWRQTADFVHNYFFKGSLIGIEGELQTRSFTDKNNNTRHVTEVNVTGVEFVGRKDSENGGNLPKKEISAEDLFKDELQDFTPVNDTDLPF